MLERFEGDEMPTESEFVASLETRKGKGKVPTLEATEQQLARYPVQTPESSAETDAAAAAVRSHLPAARTQDALSAARAASNLPFG
jgi:outer membrane protein assembly factor BamE